LVNLNGRFISNDGTYFGAKVANSHKIFAEASKLWWGILKFGAQAECSSFRKINLYTVLRHSNYTLDSSAYTHACIDI